MTALSEMRGGRSLYFGPACPDRSSARKLTERIIVHKVRVRNIEIIRLI